MFDSLQWINSPQGRRVLVDIQHAFEVVKPAIAASKPAIDQINTFLNNSASQHLRDTLGRSEVKEALRQLAEQKEAEREIELRSMAEQYGLDPGVLRDLLDILDRLDDR